MQIGMIGLGRMGANMVRRLLRDGHECVVYDINEAAVATLAREGAIAASSLEAFVDRLEKPRCAWLMLPAAFTGQMVGKLAALMVGGDADAVSVVQPIFDALKPEGDGGFVHAGPVGAGHFTKMVHNGIEYGIMQAYGEGYELMKASELVPNADAVVASWREGTVIRSWLLDLLVRALEADPGLATIRDYAQDSGEGRWTIEAAIQHAIPLPVITAALFARFASRQDSSMAMKVVAALRQQFGGHAVGHEGSASEVPVS
jgi:6-phosphogluconate dehydrogenase